MERRLRWRWNLTLRRASASLRFFFSRASSWYRLCRSVRRWPDLLTSRRRRMMTESTDSPLRTLILMLSSGAAFTGAGAALGAVKADADATRARARNRRIAVLV